MTEKANVVPPEQVGFVGLGNMGVPMINRLLEAGFQVRGFDIHESAGVDLEGRDGYSRVYSLPDVAAGSRAVVLMLPNSSVVADVLVDAGLLDSMEPSATVVDMGSSQPEETQRMAREAERRGIRLVGAPVSGGVPSATDGTLTVMPGGPPEWVDVCRPILEKIGKNVVHVGDDVGSGHALKAINNLLSASHLIASSEALLIGTRFGLEPNVMMDAINGSSGESYSTRTKWPRYIIPRTFQSGFLLQLLLKDIRIAAELAQTTGVTATHSEATVALWSAASEELEPDADHTEIFRWLEGRSQEGD